MKIIQQSAKLIGLMIPVDTDDDGNITAFRAFSPGINGLALDGPERLIEDAGRTCYKSEGLITPSSCRPFITKVCKKLHHESVMEHSCASIRIVTDRGISHEAVRHRIASYSQESTRYVNYAKDKHGKGDIQFILPVDLTDEQEKFFLSSYEIMQNMYLHAIEIGCTPQQARDLLPTGVKTEFVMTCNFREWLHFIKLRGGVGAHPKMRILSQKIHKILLSVAPTIFTLEEA